MAFIKKISSNLADAELVLLYQQKGDLNVLADLYQRYMDLIYGVCLKYLENPDDAKDAVISIYEELIGKVKKHDINFFKPWLYQLSKNYCLQQLRSSKRAAFKYDIELVHLDENLHLEDVLQKEANFQYMAECLNELTQEQRTVVEMFYLKDASYHSISQATGLELGKVRSFIQNGRRNLKICMEKRLSAVK